jgi:hypothetical protein
MDGLMCLVTLFQFEKWETDDDLREISVGKTVACYVSFLLQLIFLPIFAGVFAAMAGVSIGIQFAMEGNVTTSISVAAWATLPLGIVWALASLELQVMFAKHKALLFRPWNSLLVFLVHPLWDTIRGRGMLWVGYSSILAECTYLCYKLAQWGGCFRLISELFMLVLVLSWSCWPQIPVAYFQKWVWFSLTAPLTLFLLYRGIYVDELIKKNSKPADQRETPAMQRRAQRLLRRQEKLVTAPCRVQKP